MNLSGSRYISISCFLVLSCLLVISSTTRLSIKQFNILPTQCIYVLCMNVRIHSDYFPAENELICFYQPKQGVFAAQEILNL